MIQAHLNKNIKNPIGMRLFANITSQAFSQSYRSFEKDRCVHTFSEYSRTSGLGFLHNKRHRYLYQAS